MDPELLIEDYLLDRLPADERKAFEAQLAANPALADEVEIAQAMLVDEYLADTLDDERRRAFDARLDKDPLLREELELDRAIRFNLQHREAYRNFREGLREMAEQEDVEPLPVREPENPSVKPGPKTSWRWAAGLAAGLTLLLTAWYFYRQAYSPERSALSQFKAPVDQIIQSADLTYMGDASDKERDLARFERLFKQKRFADAQPILAPYVEADSSGQLRLYAGICRLYLGTLDNAVQDFTRVRQGNAYVCEATLLLAIAYAEQKNWPQAADMAAAVSPKCNTAIREAAGKLAETARRESSRR